MNLDELYTGDRKAMIGALNKMKELIQNCSDEDIQDIKNSHSIYIQLSNDYNIMKCEFTVSTEAKE